MAEPAQALEVDRSSQKPLARCPAPPPRHLRAGRTSASCSERSLRGSARQNGRTLRRLQSSAGARAQLLFPVPNPVPLLIVAGLVYDSALLKEQIVLLRQYV